MKFVPKLAYIDKRCLDYDMDYTLYILKKYNVPIVYSRNIKIVENSHIGKYTSYKNIVYFTINNEKKLKPCRPSADYQFSLSKSCPGLCEYCYLQTSHGEKPYIRIFVNINNILDTIDNHIKLGANTFECASLTDPIALDYLTNNLAKTIEFFGKKDGKLRLVSKYDYVEAYLNLKHNNNTKIRFSINTDYVINKFEHGTCTLDERINAAKKIALSGYPLGFIIAPIMIYKGYKEDYKKLVLKIRDCFKDYQASISFELIQHRYTDKARELILKRFPNTDLDMDDANRTLKWGPYGQFKHIYKKEDSLEMKTYICDLISKNIEGSYIEYFT